MRAADANVLVRLIARDDAKQTAAAEAFTSGGVWISHLVLTETTWVLSSAYGMNHGQLATAVGMLLQHESITLQDSDVVAAALERYRARPSVGFSDCLILEVARKAGHLPLATFDRGFGKADGTEFL